MGFGSKLKKTFKKALKPINSLTDTALKPLSFLTDTVTDAVTDREHEKTKRKEMEIDAAAASEARAAETAAANAETARLAKIKEDEANLVRRSTLLGQVKRRLSGRSASNTRLSSAEV